MGAVPGRAGVSDERKDWGAWTSTPGRASGNLPARVDALGAGFLPPRLGRLRVHRRQFRLAVPPAPCPEKGRRKPFHSTPFGGRRISKAAFVSTGCVFSLSEWRNPCPKGAFPVGLGVLLKVPSEDQGQMRLSGEGAKKHGSSKKLPLAGFVAGRRGIAAFVAHVRTRALMGRRQS